MIRRADRLVFAAAAALLLLLPRTASAQTAVADGEVARTNLTHANPMRANATRAELENLAQAQPALADAIRERLRIGDFRAGDRIVVVVEGDSMLNDTIVVTEGPSIKMLSLPSTSLDGVLRSELLPHLSAWVTKYYRNANVRATPLVRFGVLGEVNRPGYYRLPMTISITDAIMNAGGPTQRADMPRTILRRHDKAIVTRGALREAMAAGLTLDELGADAGDELIVGSKPERHWMTIVQGLTLLSGLALSLHASHAF